MSLREAGVACVLVLLLPALHEPHVVRRGRSDLAGVGFGLAAEPVSGGTLTQTLTLTLLILTLLILTLLRSDHEDLHAPQHRVEDRGRPLGSGLG